MRSESFSGKVALITGGASGIGAALGRALAASGAEVVLADRQAKLAEETAKRIQGEGGKASALEVDVRTLASVSSMVEETVARAKRIDLFFNNAGIGVAGEMDQYQPRDWDDVFDVNLRGVAYGIQCVYPVMIKQHAGHIVNTASMAGLLCPGASGSYVATKHAVVGLSRSLRVEARRHGVRVSALCPGAIATPILTGGKYGRMEALGVSKDKVRQMWDRVWPMDVDVFAPKVLREVAKDTEIIIFPRWWKALWYIDRLSPALGSRVSALFLSETRKELAASHAERAKTNGHPAANDVETTA
jgi:NAD(P)-dependent dehydrogenase (short-subunit alcohol dehydrogenase family)